MATQFPTWIHRTWTPEGASNATRDVLRRWNVHTVCQSARCPNRSECWGHGTATVMILGASCTRKCAFCAVTHDTPEPADSEEPRRVAEALRELDLAHAVITSVTRDDLPDGGASHFAATIAQVRSLAPRTKIEVLTSDFQGNLEHVDTVLRAQPDVFSHNIETVERLFPAVRDRRADYRASLRVLRHGADHAPHVPVKSALMVGHGESESEVRATLRDLREAGCVAICIGQYLQPSKRERPVAEFVPPERFEGYARLARETGFAYVASGPFVRSSYRSVDLWTALESDTRRGEALGRTELCAMK